MNDPITGFLALSSPLVRALSDASPEDLSFEPIAIMLPRGDPDFGWRLTLGSRVFGSGEIFEIYRKYVCGITPHVWLWGAARIVETPG